MTLHCTAATERWPLREPFEIAREVMHELPVIVVTLADDAGHVGLGEAAGVDYDGETPETMRAQIAAVAPQLRQALTPDELAQLLPAGGARNALDCALWDLRAKQGRVPAWRLAGLSEPRPVLSALTIGLGSVAEVRRRAREAAGHALVKLKLDTTRHIAWLQAVREELPQVRLIVDANQAWDAALLERLLPALVEAGVELIEQPLPRGGDAALAGLDSPIPIAADESCTDRTSLPALSDRYQAVNIKLDKCGGLSEALALARDARAAGLHVMVGNMCGSSLAMAPAFLVAQQARWADLDGPLLQRGDRAAPLRYDPDGLVHPPTPALWG